MADATARFLPAHGHACRSVNQPSPRLSGTSNREEKEMTERTDTTAPRAWYSMSADEVASVLGVDPRVALSSSEAGRRLEQHGPNRLDEAAREPRWRAFLRQFQNLLLIIILLVAAVVSLLVTREWGTPIAIAVVVILNATIGFVQESRAEASLEALSQMALTTATVHRDGGTLRINSEELVPGDVVNVEAGDWVPADGRLLIAASLEVQESALPVWRVPSASRRSRRSPWMLR